MKFIMKVLKAYCEVSLVYVVRNTLYLNRGHRLRVYLLSYISSHDKTPAACLDAAFILSCITFICTNLFMACALFPVFWFGIALSIASVDTYSKIKHRQRRRLFETLKKMEKY